MNDINFAVQVMVLGFSVVIVTLVGLYFLLIIFARVFHERNDSKTAVPEKKPRVISEETSAESGEENRKTAAIFAAVYSYLQLHNQIKGSSRISIAIQPVGASSADGWHIIGRKALMDNRAELERIRRMKQRENIQGSS